MNEEELMLLLQSLSPGELEALGLGGLFGPQLNQASYDLSASMPIPGGTFDSKGRPEPYDLDTAAKAANVRQDYNSMIADNVTGAFAGPGGYGLDAFSPKMRFEGDVVQQPGLQQAEFYSGGMGYQSAIAELILAGNTPDVAVSKVIELAMTPDEELDSEEDKAQRDAIRQTIPAGRPQEAGARPRTQAEKEALTPQQQFSEQYDLSSLYDFANEIGAEVASDPRGGFTDPTTGLTYDEAPVEEWSAAAQKFMDLGLPFPTDQYTDRQYVEAMAPVDMDRWLSTMDQADTSFAQANADLNANAMPLDEMRRAYADYQTQRNNYGKQADLARQGPVERTPSGQPNRRPDPPFGVESTTSPPSPATGPEGIFRADPPQQNPLLAGFTGQKPASVYAAPASLEMKGTPQASEPTKAWGGPQNFPHAPKMREVLGRPTLFNVGESAPLGPATAPLGGKLQRAIMESKGGDGAPLSSDLLAKYEQERQKRAKADSQAYSARSRSRQAPADVLAQARQYGQSMSMRDRGQTPLNDALMQRILAIRAQGVVR